MRTADPLTGYRFLRQADHDEYSLFDPRGQLTAELTPAARSVLVHGPTRVFSEPRVTPTVTTDAWVYRLTHPFSPDQITDTTFRAELAALVHTENPDLLTVAVEYLTEAPDRCDGTLRYAGDASYGPVEDAVVQEGSDFNDYLGIPWVYFDGSIDQPEEDQLGSLDCSGYIRMVYGYRMGWPLENQQLTGTRIPRRAIQIEASAPGATIIPLRTGKVASSDLSRLHAGDLLFWDADPDDVGIDHVGLYLGLDSEGKHRFISSRKRANGPTMGDIGGRSVLDHPGALYTESFRTAKRI